jgi:MFS family permease
VCVTCGFCASIIATTLGQPTFITSFNLGNIDKSQSVIGAIQGLFPAGVILGALSTNLIADRYGRRKTVFVGSLLAITGGGLQAGSVKIWMFVFARLISGLGVGNLVTVVPLWQSEISSPATRGFLVGLHGVFLLCGYSFANWVGVGFYYVNASGKQWRMPLAIQCFTTLILLAVVMRMPESPRWLVQQYGARPQLRTIRA